MSLAEIERAATWLVGRPSKMIEEKVDEVRDQFRNNGGSTMRDRVDAVAEVTGACPAPRVGPPPEDAE